MNRDKSGGDIRDHHWNEERGDSVWSLRMVYHRLVIESLNSPNSTAKNYSNSCFFFICEGIGFYSAVIYSLNSCGHSVLSERVKSSSSFTIHEITSIKAFKLTSKFRFNS